MKQLLALLCAICVATPAILAVSYTAGGSTYTYTEKSTQRLNSGVVHHRLRFTSPKTLNVQIVEVDLSDPNVRVETSLGSDKLFSAQSLVNRYNALKTAGRKPLVVQNASFWAMSSQASIIDDGKFAANSCLGGLVQNGKMIYETNSALNTWVGMRHSVVGFKSDKTGFCGQYKTNIRLMCPTRWGSNENTNILQPTEVNKYCHYGTIAVFNQAFPSTREIKVVNSTSGQPGTAMTSSDARYVFLNLKSGQSERYGEWVDYTIAKISDNCCSATRGNYDLVIVFAIGNHSAVSALQVGDAMRMKYMWHPQGQTDPSSMTPIPGLENMVAGESQPMVNGVVQTPSDYGATTYSRSAYGISQDGKKLIMCVIDKSTDATYGSSSGCTTTVMSYIMQHWGAYNIVNCDAGGSAQMVIGGKQVGTPSDSRGIVSSIVVFDEGSGDTGGDVQQGDTGSDTPSGNVGAVTPGAGSANPFAYDVTGNYANGSLTVNYKLNSAAKSVTLNVSGEGNSGRQYTLSGKSKGTHSQTVDVSSLTAGDYSWGIIVEGNPVSAPIEFTSVGFNHPQGLAVVQDTNDPYYGTLIITEGRPSSNSAHWSSSRGGQGIYLFDPQMNGIPQSGNNYAFRGGLTDANYIPVVGSTNQQAYATAVQNGTSLPSFKGSCPRKIRITKDGRIFFSTQSCMAAPLYEIVGGVAGLIANNSFRQVMGGPIELSNSSSDNYFCWVTGEGGAFSSAPNVGFDVTGTGSNLKITMLGGRNRMFNSSDATGTTCHTYNLGSKQVWGGAEPSSSFAALTGKYLVNYTGANISYDNRGNIWFSQYRGVPAATTPSIVVFDPNGNELLKDATTVIGGGGLAFNNDFTQVMHSSSATTFSVYDLDWDANGKPVRTEKYRITHGLGTNVNAYAWDLAGNLYACGNSGEKLKGFAMPRTDLTVETTARSIFNFTIEAPAAPEQEDPVIPDPVITTNVTSRSFSCEVGENASQGVTVTGANLQGDITASLTGANAAMFALNTTTIAKSAGSGTITVTYTPTAAGSHNATLTLTSTNAAAVNVSLSGTATEPQVPGPDPETPITRAPGETYLTKVWETASTVGASDARFGAGNPVTGEVYAANKTNGKIYAYTSEGESVKYELSGIGTGISCDAGGNILVNMGFSGAGSGINWRVIPANAGLSDLKTITLADAYKGRTDAVGRTLGDVMSAEGGLLATAPAALSTAVLSKIASGALVETRASGTYTIANASVTYAVPQGVTYADQMQLPNWAYAVDVYSHNNNIQIYDASTGIYKKQARQGANCYGFDIMMLGGKKYVIQGYGTSTYTDGFLIYDTDLTHYHTFAGASGTNSSNYLSINAWPRDSRTIDIYEYVAGRCARCFEFSLDPIELYMTGDVVPLSRSAAVSATKGEGSIYTFNSVNVADSGDGFGYVKFATTEDGSGNLYAASSPVVLASAESSPIILFSGDGVASAANYALAAGSYDVAVDLASGHVTATRIVSGVESVEDSAANQPVEYYNLQGVKVSNPAKGQILIRRQGASATKVLIR